jgi:predicted flap endonuclease-1-like 5' DNA nuclease
MTFNAPLLFETAMLMLAAFLLGAVIGLVLRLLLARPKPVVATVAADVQPAAAAAIPELVKAPDIAPLPTNAARPSGARRLAATSDKAAPDMAAVKMPEMTLPSMPVIASMEPSHVAGETVSGRHIDNPEHPQSASIEDVRAELVAQIEASPEPGAGDVAATAATPELPDTEIVPAAVAAAEPAIPEADDALAAEAATPMLAEVSDAEAESPLPTEDRVEPEIEATPVLLTDAPAEVAADIQDVIETPVEDPVPEVVAEAPLVRPVEEEARTPQEAPKTADDEMAAMRAIEGGWSPRRTGTRKPADLPEGVSAAEVAAADQAVVNSGAAVANATALATAVLEEVAAARPARPPGGFGRPASIAAPREGRKDDFSLIKGLGPAIESSLNGLGIYHYDQIAEWDQKAVVWIENHFGFKGRITRERWQEQARDLVRGKPQVARPVRR